MKLLTPAAPVPGITRLQIRSFYSASDGFYCSMYPVAESLSRLVDHFDTIPQLKGKVVPPSLMHVTLMYSKQAVPMDQLPWINRDVRVPGTVIGYDFFCNPHATSGAVVMLLDSEEIVNFHEELAELADYTWDEFKPHATVAYDVSPVDAAIVISALMALPLPTNLLFTAPVFEDKS